MKVPLSEKEQESLRQRCVITSQELAYKKENNLYAENVFTGDVRLISVQESNLLENKIILFG